MESQIKMTTPTLAQRLDELRAKQKKIDDAWKKTGNKPLLEFFVELIPRALNCERCSIFVLDPEADNVWVQCGTGLKEHQVSVPRADSLVGQVISTGQFQNDSEMENRVGPHEWVDMQTGFVTRNVLCVPVRGVTQEIVTGAIQVLNKKSFGKFTDDDRKILEKLAAHIQMNIEHIYLRQQLAKLLEETSKAVLLLESRLS